MEELMKHADGYCSNDKLDVWIRVTVFIRDFITQNCAQKTHCMELGLGLGAEHMVAHPNMVLSVGRIRG